MDNVQNIFKVWEQVDSIDLHEGMTAYEKYNQTMCRLAWHYDFPLSSVVGAFCALSPNNDYMGNLRSLVTVLKGFREHKLLWDLTVSTYDSCKYRAWRCLLGQNFMTFTKGPKTRSFYINIMKPTDNYAVTIDGHMYSVWYGKYLNMKAVAKMGFDYEAVAHDFRTVAFSIGIVPCQLQACLWFTWKRINNAVYNPQLGLFCADDHWGLLPDVKRIKEFTCNDASPKSLDHPAPARQLAFSTLSNKPLAVEPDQSA